MTRKHFAAIANVIAGSRLTHSQRRELAEEMAMALRPFSDQFNTERFIAAATDTEGN